MKKLIAILLTMVMLTGCGTSNIDNPVTVEALSTVEEAKEEPVVEETLQEEVTTNKSIITEELTKSLKSAIEETEEAALIALENQKIEQENLFWNEYKGDLRDVSNLINTIHQLDDVGMYGTVEVPDEVKKEYERRIEEGFSYDPSTVYNRYSDFSDAEIIEMVKARFLELHNEKRAELGLTELKLDERLCEVATIRAEEGSYFLNHTRPNGEWFDTLIPWDGSSLQDCGENISWAVKYEPFILEDSNSTETLESFYSEMADSGFDWLCNSPKHYENITNVEYKYIGIDSYIFRNKYGDVAITTAFEFCSGGM